MSNQTKHLAARVCQVMTWLIVLAIPVMFSKWTLESMETKKAAAAIVNDMLQQHADVRVLLLEGWLYIASIISIPFILAYLAFAVFGYRISFRREAKQLWRI